MRLYYTDLTRLTIAWLLYPTHESLIFPLGMLKLRSGARDERARHRHNIGA